MKISSLDSSGVSFEGQLVISCHMSSIKASFLTFGVAVLFLMLSPVALAASSADAPATSDVPFNVDTIMTDEELAAELGPAPAEPVETILDRIANLNRPRGVRFTPADGTAHENIRGRLSNELLSYYETILYVNKAAKGSTAQTLRIFTRTSAGGDWVETKRLKVSTGREKQEQYFTSTPAGVFNIDGQRVFKIAYSAKWGGSPMPFAMFFDVQFASRKTGIAIHGAPHGSENKLGSRASGGCIRVGNKEVEELYKWITGSLQGEVPAFAWDKARGKTSSDAVIERDASGQPVLKKGYKALVVIVDVQD